MDSQFINPQDMKLAWPTPEAAYKYAFNLAPGSMASIVILLHKDRLASIFAILGNPYTFEGRWRGLISSDRQFAFIALNGNATDAFDCVLHLVAFPPKFILHTGTCGSISSKHKIADICLVKEGWYNPNMIDGLKDIPRFFDNISFTTPLPSLNVSLTQTIFTPPLSWAKVLSVPSQVIESPFFLQRTQKMGAQLIDMETAFCLSAARLFDIPSCALLWVTDSPIGFSYYHPFNKSQADLKKQRWNSWPAFIIAFVKGISSIE